MPRPALGHRNKSGSHACPPRLRNRAPATHGCTRFKHDGFRVIARKDGDRVRLYSRPGNDLTYRFR
jgi:ATP-dependent DNA ligase